MHLKLLETFVVAPPDGLGGRYFIFVKLTSSDGIVGYGEVYSVPFRPNIVEGMIADVFERHLLGHSPFHIERLYREVYSMGFTQRPDVSVGGILSGLEMACWDIVGKAVDKPIYELLGGKVRDRVRTYTYLYNVDEDDRGDAYVEPDAAADRAAAYVAKGHTAVKADPVSIYTAYDGRQLRLETTSRVVEFVRKVREAVGDKADILFGTHGQMTPSGAIRLAKQLEPYDPLWFEEPTPPDIPEAMAQVARATSIPIATGERLTSKHEFARLLRHEAASILQLNTARAGGLLEGKKIAALGEVHGAQIAPHCYNGPIGCAANLQLATCTPNFLILEGIREFGGFRGELLTKPLHWEAGFVQPPTAPGLGVELNEAVARAHPYTGDQLHLDMTMTPDE